MREAAERWARALLGKDPVVTRIGYFGSYATGREGVGSDLDLVVVVRSSEGPLERRSLRFDTTSLPVPCDLLVYTDPELESLLARGDRFAAELRERAVWFTRAS